MREIKFRAWDTRKNAWMTADEIMERVLVNPSWEGKQFQLDEKSDKGFAKDIGYSFELMQYTGLKDKNGKEIYEGDLLRHPPKDKWEETNFVAFEVFYHDNDCADKHVGFQMNRLHFQGSLGGYSMLENFLPKYTAKMEVIGNIYENPNLLRRPSYLPNHLAKR